MKARVKATGEIITIESDTMFIGKDYKGVVKPYYDSDIDIIKDEPDYWEKLRHQYAGMAMQGMLGNSDYIERFTAHTIDGISDEDDIAKYAKDYATALVNRFKEEEK
jgi:hypothetical protein